MKKPLLITLASIFTIVIIVLLFNLRFIKVWYFDYKNNHFKRGDKVYLPEYDVTDPSVIGATVFFYIKKKEAGRTVVKKSAWGISTDSLVKHKSAFIGNYIQREIIDIKSKGKYIPAIVYAIKPERSAMTRDYDNKYLDADFSQGGYFYVMYFHVTDKEAGIFRVKR